MRNTGGCVCFGRRNTPRGGHTRRNNTSPPREQTLNTRYVWRIRGWTAKASPMGSCPTPWAPSAGSPQSRGHEGGSSEEWRSLLGPWPGACAGRARAQAGKLRDCYATALYTPYSPSASAHARDTNRKAAGSDRAGQKRQKRGTKVALLLKVPLGKRANATTPPCLCVGVGLVPARQSGKGADCPKGSARHGHGGIYPHRLQRCGWPRQVWP